MIKISSGYPEDKIRVTPTYKGKNLIEGLPKKRLNGRWRSVEKCADGCALEFYPGRKENMIYHLEVLAFAGAFCLQKKTAIPQKQGGCRFYN